MKTYLRVLSYARGLGWYIPQYVITVILYAIFSVVNIALLAPMIDVLFNQVDAKQLIATAPEFSLSLNYFLDLF